ncbi:ATP-binding protein [Frankia sp. CNm7]|uniref:ATP-binding protein n=1 Tax=Frankia nepalensis TaxID=1836974 RepID=A0A937RHR7_9ACTN|nr:ATP-binding protein [Frankia nepalensis]MBL7498720.1 ATP-binding protein [Frankia nepalensis]MBL7508415.1 ATP-binding protein [Frankia nepalensis]MBL7522433.1 ATP-binding protein [Frankia nepalensis]MBL7626246.1 ATP-binding protein [Frankia nepalensis]
MPVALPWDIATTAHLCALSPLSIESALPPTGPLLGTDRLAGGAFHFDLITAYEHGLIQGPNMLISGAGAHGKSALAKAYLHRTTALTTPAGRPRWTAVLDPKGEWTTLGHRLGHAVLRLQPGGTLRVNPLDTTPGITATTAPAAARPATRPVGGHAAARTSPTTRSATSAPRHRVPAGQPDDETGDEVGDVAARRAAVLETLLAIALDRPALDPGQQRLLVETARRLTTRPGAAASGPDAPTLHDVRHLLAQPDHTLADDLDTTLDELLDRRRPLLDATVTLLEHDLRGICDGPTSTGLRWHTAPGLVLDLSALLTQPRTLKLVLTAATGWLAAVMYGQPHAHKVTIVDEAWIALDDPAITRHLHNQWRLGRQFGQVNILITHAIADLDTQRAGPAFAGTRTAEGLLNTTSVRVYLHQNPEHVGRLLTDMGLTRRQAALLDQLPPFTALWQIGARTALVDHHITSDEWTFADTDTAMTNRT